MGHNYVVQGSLFWYAPAGPLRRGECHNYIGHNYSASGQGRFDAANVLVKACGSSSSLHGGSAAIDFADELGMLHGRTLTLVPRDAACAVYALVGSKIK